MLHTLQRHLPRFLACVAAGLLLVLLYILILDNTHATAATRFDAADVCVQTTSESRHERAGFNAVFLHGGAPVAHCWQAMALPHHISPTQEAGQDGSKLSQAWFKVRYQVPLQPVDSENLMIYVPRVMGSAWQVRINDTQVANNLEDWRMTWNTPLAIRIDPSYVRPGQMLDIRLGVMQRPEYGVSIAPIFIGPASSLMPALSWRRLLQITMPQASSVILLLMGGFFFAFWLARRHESMHLLLALASVAWCVCNLQYVQHRPDDAWWAACYTAMVNMAISWVMWLIYLFVLRIDAQQRVRWLERALPWYVLFMTLVAVPVWPHSEDIGVIYHLLNSLVATGVTIVIARRAWRRHGRIELRLISLALASSLMAGTHDVALLAQLLDPQGIYLLPYSTLLIFASFLFAVQRRYVNAIAETEHLSASLAQRLAAREDELRVQHARLLTIEREQALLLERQRLMRDMHDGLGSTLMSSLVLVEQGQMKSQDLALMLRECVDDLRLVIDSLEPMGHDLVTLLATLRYRLGKRLEHAGLALEWAVQDLPSLPWLDPSHALQVLRIVQETLTNILKHAEASRVRIETLLLHKPGLPDQVCVQIEDDGKGFDMNTITAGRGLRHLRHRAQKVHGDLDIHSEAGQGTRITLLLPVELCMR
ncbi:MAG: sensor histidine kinase [Aquabacterium sp.]|uniref:sensor histidine kinase n=1 Tax=Aquabacterium sp. TaxID=1872578 RepID=UPI00120B6F01|nr:sensor histidine kinase [Aquabacterium sp.]TAK99718.1 MAG: sensor histidine kinase [Aquabacterium sp.]